MPLENLLSDLAVPLKGTDTTIANEVDKYDILNNLGTHNDIFGKNLKANQELDAKRSSGGMIFDSKDAEAFARGMIENNFLANMVNKAEQNKLDDRYQLDKTFRDSYKRESIYEDINKFSLDPVDDYARLSMAKNNVHRMQIIDELKYKNDKKRLINETISPYTRIAANLAGTITDVDMLLIGPLAGILAKGGKVSKVFAASTGVETAGAIAKSQMVDDYDLFKDGLGDIVIGSFIDTSIAKMISGRNLSNSVSQITENNKINIDDNLKLIEYKPERTSEFNAEYNTIKKSETVVARESRINEIDLELNQTKTKGKNKGQLKIVQGSKKWQELYGEKTRLLEENKLEDTIGMEEALLKIKAREEEKTISFMDSLKQKQRDEQLRRDKEIELANLEKKAEEFRAKLKTNHQKEIELENARLKEIELERKKMVNESLAIERDRLEKRKYFTEQFSSKKYDNIPLKMFYKSQDDIIEKARKELNPTEFEKLQKRTHELEDLVHAMGTDVKQVLSRIGRAVKYDVIDVEEIPKTLEILKTNFPNEAKILRKVENYIVNHRMNDIDSEEILNGLINDHFGGLTKFQRTSLIALLTIAPMHLFANQDGPDNESILYSGIGMALLAVIIGPSVASKIRNKTVKRTLLEAQSSLSNLFKSKSYLIEGEGKPLFKAVGNVQKNISTGFNSSFKGFMNKIDNRIYDKALNEKAKNFVRNLLLNPIDGSHASADVEIMQMSRAATSQMHFEYKKAFTEYKKEKNISWISSKTEASSHEREFDNMIWEMVEGTKPTKPEYAPFVDEIRNMTKKLLDDSAEAGVKNADKIKHNKNYMPRIWKMTELKHILGNISKSDFDNIAKAMAKGIKGEKPDEVAVKLLTWIKESDISTVKKTDGTLDDLEKVLNNNDILPDDKALKELRDALTTREDAAARLKFRIDINFSKIDFPKILYKGETKQLVVDDMVDRNIRDVLDTHANNMYANIALARRGFTTLKSARDFIGSISKVDSELGEELNMAIDVLFNKPIAKDLTPIREIMESAKAITFMTLMPLVSFSMSIEVAKTIANSGFSNTLKAMKHQMKMLDKNSVEYALLMDSSGLGTHGVRNRFNYRGAEQYTADDTSSWAITQMLRRGQETVAKYSGLIDISDITQKANYLHHVTEFAKIINGMPNKLVSSRLSSYGIDDKTLELFKDDFKFSSNNDLMRFDKNNWTLEKRVKFADIMSRLNQEITPEVYLGTSGLWQHTSHGRVFGFLLSYPLNLIENQGVKDLHYWDSRSLSNTLITFGASYVGLMAKYEMLEREYEHETLVAYSLMNLPAFSLLGALKSLPDPAVVSTLAGWKDEAAAITANLYQGE